MVIENKGDISNRFLMNLNKLKATNVNLTHTKEKKIIIDIHN